MKAGSNPGYLRALPKLSLRSIFDHHLSVSLREHRPYNKDVSGLRQRAEDCSFGIQTDETG